MFTWLLYGLALAVACWSYRKDKQKTKMALRKAWKSFENILPEFLGIFVFVGILLAVIDPSLIMQVIGSSSGWTGVIISSVVGAVTLIPGFIAFPLAATLLQSGAGLMQIGAFIASLMMVGVVTLPVEIKYFGKRVALLRNSLAFVFSFVVAFVIGMVV